jgi:hypothetical protein
MPPEGGVQLSQADLATVADRVRAVIHPSKQYAERGAFRFRLITRGRFSSGRTAIVAGSVARAADIHFLATGEVQFASRE